MSRAAWAAWNSYELPPTAVVSMTRGVTPKYSAMVSPCIGPASLASYTASTSDQVKPGVRQRVPGRFGLDLQHAQAARAAAGELVDPADGGSGRRVHAAQAHAHLRSRAPPLPHLASRIAF